MIAVTIFISIACAFVSVLLFREAGRSKGKLLSRLSALAPGALSYSTSKRTKRIRRLSKSMSLLIDEQLVDLVEMLASVLQAGQSLFQALSRVCSISDSALAKEISILLDRVELGGQLSDELGALCQRIPTDSIREFSNKLSLAIVRGTPLSNSLLSLAASLRASTNAALLKRAGANETKMLIPVVLLICPVTVIFALYPSSQFLTVGF